MWGDSDASEISKEMTRQNRNKPHGYSNSAIADAIRGETSLNGKSLSHVARQVFSILSGSGGSY